MKSSGQNQKKRGYLLTKKDRQRSIERSGVWCVAANKYRCMRCGRSNKNMKMQGECEGPKWLKENSKHKLGRWNKTHLGGHDMVRRVDRNGEAVIWRRKC